MPFDHSECPYAPQAMRNTFREALWRLEEALPGTRHAIMSTREKLVDILAASQPPFELGRCTMCGEPASGTLCRACSFLESAAERAAH